MLSSAHLLFEEARGEPFGSRRFESRQTATMPRSGARIRVRRASGRIPLTVTLSPPGRGDAFGYWQKPRLAPVVLVICTQLLVPVHFAFISVAQRAGNPPPSAGSQPVSHGCAQVWSVVLPGWPQMRSLSQEAPLNGSVSLHFCPAAAT